MDRFVKEYSFTDRIRLQTRADVRPRDKSWQFSNGWFGRCLTDASTGMFDPNLKT